jgi:hypothetical protein
MKGNELERDSERAVADIDENEARLVGDLVREIMDGIGIATPDAVHPRVGNVGAGLKGEEQTSPCANRQSFGCGGGAIHAAALCGSNEAIKSRTLTTVLTRTSLPARSCGTKFLSLSACNPKSRSLMP